MNYNPWDFSISGCPRYSNWGNIVAHTVCILHKPTNTSVTRIAKTIHKARDDAYLELLKILETETDTFNQTELF